MPTHTHMSLPAHSLARRLSVAAALLLVTACRESTDPGDPEPEVATMRLTVGTSTVNIAENGAVTGGPLRISTADQLLTASFLKADGTVESLVIPDVFELRLTNLTGVTFTRTGAFSGNIRGAAAGPTTINAALFHLVEGHEDFGPFPVAVLIQ